MNLLIGALVVFIIGAVVWAIHKATSPQPESSTDDDSGFLIRQTRGNYVEETLLDDGVNFYHVKRGKSRTFVRQWRERPGSWKIAIHETTVRGCNHHPDAARRFLSARAPWLDLEREPTNEYDPNAIKVMSTWTNPDGSVHREHLGYVAKEEAAAIVGDLSPDHPLAASITAMGPSEKYVASVDMMIEIATSWCPLCKGDLGRAPRQPGKCKSCGGSFVLSPVFRVAVVGDSGGD